MVDWFLNKTIPDGAGPLSVFAVGEGEVNEDAEDGASMLHAATDGSCVVNDLPGGRTRGIRHRRRGF